MNCPQCSEHPPKNTVRCPRTVAVRPITIKLVPTILRIVPGKIGITFGLEMILPWSISSLETKYQSTSTILLLEDIDVIKIEYI